MSEQAGLRVLLVEDDSLVAGPVEEELAEAGCPVISTPYGTRALALSRNFAFDAAIVNLRLPDMDGAALVNRLAEEAPSLALVVFTGLVASPADRTGLPPLPARAVLLGKPSTASELMEALALSAQAAHTTSPR